jgi:hypothetical protein
VVAFFVMDPVCQPGVVWPPWQLTLEQVKADGLAFVPAVPLFALKVPAMATEAGPLVMGVVTRLLALL